jgi:glucose-6-phosphate isomerase
MAATSSCATRSCATPAVRGAVAAGARVFADLSKNRWDLFTRKLLIELAHECGMPARRDAMSGGEPVNTTEGRSVLHTALRVPSGLSPHSNEVHAVLDAMFAFASVSATPPPAACATASTSASGRSRLIGDANFRALLVGARAMDRHFAAAPLESNLPVQLGLLDVWYRNFQRFTSRWVAPYHQSLRRLPAYLQQPEMESNGKGVDFEGHALPYATSPVVWGEPAPTASTRSSRCCIREPM